MFELLGQLKSYGKLLKAQQNAGLKVKSFCGEVLNLSSEQHPENHSCVSNPDVPQLKTRNVIAVDEHNEPARLSCILFVWQKATAVEIPGT